MSSIKRTKRPQGFLLFSFIYCLFIVYGSLVPLDYRPIPFEQAWQSFQQIRYLNLGAASRADWIANIVLYIPLTFALSTHFADKAKASFELIALSVFILVFTLALAISIEFCQQFFPPRTVSLNDLIAETIGSVLGLALGLGYGKRFVTLYRHILSGGKEAFLASATLYALGYLAISFFPYDFVTSFQELQDKMASGNNAWLFASNCGDLLRCGVKLSAEILMSIPLGIFFGVLLKWHPQRLTAVMLIGLIFGMTIESIQVFLVSGVAQGVSMFTRVIGMGLGEKLYKRFIHLDHFFPATDYRKYIISLTIPYLLIIAHLNGWSLTKLETSNAVADKFHHIKWLPFYYHYYSTEPVALTSLLSILLMYFPVGLGMWLWKNSIHTNAYSINNLKSGFLATGLSLIMETGKLYFIGKHPDPTNIIIAFVSAYLTFSVADTMSRWLRQPSATAKRASEHESSDGDNYTEEETKSTRFPIVESASPILYPEARFIAAVCAMILLWKVYDYPGNSIALGIMLLLYATLLAKYPHSWLIALPAFLPIANLAPWTGRIFYTEFDFLVLTTLAISCWHGRLASPFRVLKPLALFMLGCYAFFYSISLIKGLFPLQPLDANAFAHYYSQYNGIRIAKGLFWALCILPILAYSLIRNDHANRRIGYGLLTGLGLTSLYAIWERVTFIGLLDFNSDHRITASFYSMHTGGAHLDTFLLISLPFVCLLLTRSEKRPLSGLTALILFVIGLYTLLVTFSRGAYIAFVLAFAMLLTGLLIYSQFKINRHWPKLVWLASLILLTVVLATPVLKGSFIRHRFDQFNHEADVRSSHWQNSINMMDSSAFTYLLGMGVGSFPRTYFWRNFDDATPSTFLLQQTPKASYLQIRGGDPLYIEQIVPLNAHTRYTLQFDYRAHTKKSSLQVQICEKAIQHSFNCLSIPQTIQHDVNAWQPVSYTFNTNELGSKHSGPFANVFSKPVKLVFFYRDGTTTIEIKNVVLTAGNATDNLIKNGDFSAGMDHWFFTADDHMPWRTENQWIQILFEQGGMGVLLFSLLLLYAFYNLYRSISRQDLFAVMLLSSLTGFAVIATIDSPLDNPQLTWLFFLLLFLSFPKACRDHQS